MLIFIRATQKGHAASVLFCYDLFTRASHRQTQEFISITRSVTSLQRTSQTAPHNAHMPRVKRNKTHHVLTFTPITLELCLNEHTKGKSFRLTFLYATQHARDKPNKAGLGWVLNTCFYYISMALQFLSILDPFSWLPLLSEIMSGHP